MKSAVFNKIHTLLTTHINFKEVQSLTNKNRYLFERIGETATIQIPKNSQAKFVYIYSDEEKKETPFWLQHLIKQCNVHLQETNDIVKTENKEERQENGKQSMSTSWNIAQQTSLDLPILLKGTIENEEQRMLVKKLIQSGFEVFPDED